MENHLQHCPGDFFGLDFIAFPMLNQSVLNRFVFLGTRPVVPIFLAGIVVPHAVALARFQTTILLKHYKHCQN